MNKTRQTADRAWQGTRKNLLINGNFDIWQRGTSTTSTGYIADRWRLVANGTPTFTTSRQDFTLGQINIPGEPKHFVRVIGSQTGGTYCAFQQPMEDIRITAGQTVTVSFWAKGNGSHDINAEFSQHFGTGGSPSAQNAIASSDWTLTTSWQKFSYTATMYSVGGKTIGTNDDSRLNVNIYFPLNDTFTIDIAQVQLEFGGNATEFEQRSFGEELTLCQRYFEKSYDVTTNPGTVTDTGRSFFYITGVGSAAHAHGASHEFKVEKRTTPTLTLYSPITGTSGKIYDYVNTADVNPNASSASEYNYRWWTTMSGASSAISLGAHFTADAEF